VRSIIIDDEFGASSPPTSPIGDLNKAPVPPAAANGATPQEVSCLLKVILSFFRNKTF
jgi:hypothetical protein